MNGTGAEEDQSSDGELTSGAPSFPHTTLALLHSLLLLSREISLSDPPRAPLLRRTIRSAARRSTLLSLIFEELLRDPALALPRAAVLCLREILLVLRRLSALLDTCSARISRVRLALQLHPLAAAFHDATRDLSTLLDIFPLPDLGGLPDDVVDLVHLLRCQCRRSSPSADPQDDRLRSQVLKMVADMEREMAPDHSELEGVFQGLGLRDAGSCRDEIERLEGEIRDRVDPQRTAAMVALLGLVRYGKCVLFGASTPRRYRADDDDDNAAFPADFRCPISLDLMRDPVVVATGQTYDRESISGWMAAGHATCPKTGQPLPTPLLLLPNRALHRVISRWCRQHNVPFDPVDAEVPADPDGANKAAMEAARMTAQFLVQELAASPPVESANRIVYELRQLAKTGSENRTFIAEAGGVPLLVPLLRSEDPNLQVNAVTALLNLSILPANKKRIMKAAGGLDGVVHVLRSGASWQAKENAAATLLSLSSFHALYRRRVAGDPGIAEGLVELVRAGPATAKRDGLVTMLNLAGDRDNIGRLVEGGVVETALEAAGVPDVAEIAVAVVAAVAKRGGAPAVAAAKGSVGKLAGMMRQGTEQARESAASALVSVCRHGGGDALAELAATSGIEWVIWNLMGSGSVRGRRKAASLGRMCRRWAAATEEGRRGLTAGIDSVTLSTARS